MSDVDTELRRLRWRCRRGMRELDQLMLRYLDQCWATDDDKERAHFERLLASEDDVLWRWCIIFALLFLALEVLFLRLWKV